MYTLLTDLLTYLLTVQLNIITAQQVSKYKHK